MTTVKFSGEILIKGVNPYVLVNKRLVQQIKPGWHRPLPVVVRVNGQPSEPWHINMMPVGNGDFYLYLHGEVRKASGTKVGDVVAVEVGFDDDYQSGPSAMPAWFAEALAEQPVAIANWQQLSPSRQKEVVRYLAGLKSPEAQARNLERAMRVLSGNEERFMGRLWHDGA